MPSRNHNRALWGIVLLGLVILAFKTRDNLEAYFMGVGTLDAVSTTGETSMLHLRWTGRIDAPMASRIAEAFEKHRNVRGVALSLSSPGGDLDHGAEVIRVLRKIGATHTLETIVEAGSKCASMCVPIYLQGQRRTAAADASFMFHEVSFREHFSKSDLDVPEAAKGSATDQLFSKYFKAAGVPEAWILNVRTEMSGGHDVWKTASELLDENAGIVQQVF